LGHAARTDTANDGLISRVGAGHHQIGYGLGKLLRIYIARLPQRITTQEVIAIGAF